MRTYRYQWLVECEASVLTRFAKVVFVPADDMRIEHGCLTFYGFADDYSYALCGFAPGQWAKCEITSALTGEGNAVFPVTEEGRANYEAAHPHG
jgi:hypothetical protein